MITSTAVYVNDVCVARITGKRINYTTCEMTKNSLSICSKSKSSNAYPQIRHTQILSTERKLGNKVIASAKTEKCGV